MLPVNQLAAKIKLIEVWKTLNRPDYPISLEPYKHESQRNDHDLRTQLNRIFDDKCKLKKSESSFLDNESRIGTPLRRYLHIMIGHDLPFKNRICPVFRL